MKSSYLYIILFISLGYVLHAQDKLFFKNGKTVYGKIVSVGENTVSYKDTVNTDAIVTVPKSEVLIAEYKNGSMFIFGSGQTTGAQTVDYNETRAQRKERRLREWKEKEQTLPNNILGFYIPELAMGRLTVSYERLLANKTIGIMIPASLTYNMFPFSSPGYDSTTTSYNSVRGVNFITGLDVNFYTDLKPELKYFVGPRIRYGTDVTLDVTGYTAQIQNGIIKSKGDRFISSLSIGFGVFKPTEYYGGVNPNRFYPWGSINWRLGFRL